MCKENGLKSSFLRCFRKNHFYLHHYISSLFALRPPVKSPWCGCKHKAHPCSGSHTSAFGECSVNTSVACVGTWHTQQQDGSACCDRWKWVMAQGPNRWNQTGSYAIFNGTPLVCGTSVHTFLRMYMRVRRLLAKRVAFKVWFQEDVQLHFISSVFSF